MVTELCEGGDLEQYLKVRLMKYDGGGLWLAGGWFLYELRVVLSCPSSVILLMSHATVLVLISKSCHNMLQQHP